MIRRNLKRLLVLLGSVFGFIYLYHHFNIFVISLIQCNKFGEEVRPFENSRLVPNIPAIKIQTTSSGTPRPTTKFIALKQTPTVSKSTLVWTVNFKPKTPGWFTRAITGVASKPTVDDDMVNVVDFELLFPETMAAVERSRNDFFLLVLVNSAANGEKYRQRRLSIRQTWGNTSSCEQRKASRDNMKIKNLKWMVVFVVGKAKLGTKDDILNTEEAKKHNDMLIVNTEDNYKNNIIKFYSGLLWLSMYNAKYVLKTDDDVYVRVPRVLDYLARANFPQRFYGGATAQHSVVVRGRKAKYAKWSVSRRYFNEDFYPPYNLGPFVILSTDLLHELFGYVNKRKPFHTDDAYVGVAMRDMGVNATRIGSFVVYTEMSKRIREYDDCRLLSLNAFGHNVGPESSRILHDKLEKLCWNNKTRESC